MDPRQKLLYIVYILGISTSIGSLCTYDPMTLLAAVYRHCKIGIAFEFYISEIDQEK